MNAPSLKLEDSHVDKINSAITVFASQHADRKICDRKCKTIGCLQEQAKVAG